MSASEADIATAAEQQAAGDAALLAALRDRDGVIQPAPARRNPTIGDNFLTSASIIAQARKDTRLSEATLVKLFELQMMWALNNRQSTQQSLLGEDEEAAFITPGEGAEGTGEAGAPEPDDLPEPNERITAAEE